MLMDTDDDLQSADICRVCRSEGTSDRPLFHPCICTGSIKWIHQECLVQWMRYSRKEYCELCRYKFSFTPIYAPDMPRRLPVSDIVGGLISSVLTGLKYWIHYSIVAFAWLGIVPLIACRIFRSLFSGSLDSMIAMPLNMFSTEDIPSDIFQGSFIVMCTLFTFIGLVWLREQILNGGGPDWLEAEGNGAAARNRMAGQIAVGLNQGNNNDAAENDGEDRPAIEGGVAPAAVDEHNWNPVEWDRAAEELTWERLLGLDGSLVFLEHVFWVISLNTLFVLVFAFCPHTLGYYFLQLFDASEYATLTRFEGLVTTFVGYIVISVMLLFAHIIVSFTQLRKIKRIVGIAYIVIKVSLLLVIEIGALPLISGWWLDICSLVAFDVTLQDRENSFRLAPGTTMFIHWLVGMVFVYYFASFILLLREVVRPGVLWFLRNLNDPDFSPIQEMIQLPMLRHIRRLMASAVIFGVTIMLISWIPAKILKIVYPSFLPFIISSHTDSVNELSLELLLLQVILPALLEQSYVRGWMKTFLRNWCYVVSWVLDLKSYLIGNEILHQQQRQQEDNPRPNQDNNNDDDRGVVGVGAAAGDAGGGGLGAAHQALLFQRGFPIGYQPYVRPKFFVVRILLLLLLTALTIVVISLIMLTIPVYLGRNVMRWWPTMHTGTGSALTNYRDQGSAAEQKIHELYTASTGFYCCWVFARAVALIVKWIPRGKMIVIRRLWKSVVVGAKAIVACFWLMGIIPLLFGLLLELVIVVPLRVPLNQTPVLWTWQDWALGVLYAKIACALTLMGPDWRLRRAIDRTFRNGFGRMNLSHLMKEIVLPVVILLSIAITVPYVIAYSIVPLFVHSFYLRNLIARRIYPFLLFSTVLVILLVFQVKQFVKLYEHIKNDKYLVGRRLVNYNHIR